MQEPGKLDLKLYQGATFNYELTWTAAGSAVDLTSYDARMQVRDSYGAPTVVFNLTAGSGIALGGTAGTIALEIDAADTTGLGYNSVQSFVYDLELESSSGFVTRLVEGGFTIFPEVTR
jgi:hypothetical protein